MRKNNESEKTEVKKKLVFAKLGVRNYMIYSFSFFSSTPTSSRRTSTIEDVIGRREVGISCPFLLQVFNFELHFFDRQTFIIGFIGIFSTSGKFVQSTSIS